MFICEHFSCSAKSSLHFITNKKCIVLLAQSGYLFEISFLRNDHSFLALNRLHKICRYVWIWTQCFLQLRKIIIIDHLEIQSFERTEVLVSVRIIRTAACSECSSPEVSVGENDFSLILWHFLHIISPSSSHLNWSLSRLNTSIHEDWLIVSKKVSEFLLGKTQLIVVECSRN